jgi:hypothetical protein
VYKRQAIPHSKAPDFIRQFNYYAELTRRLQASSSAAPAPAPVEGASLAERINAGLLFGAASLQAPATGLEEVEVEGGKYDDTKEGSTAAQPDGYDVYGNHEDDDSEFSNHNRIKAFHKSWALGAFNDQRTGDEEDDSDDGMPGLEPNPDPRLAPAEAAEGDTSEAASVPAPAETDASSITGPDVNQLD